MRPHLRAKRLRRAVLFDLDDTLYPEREFVHGGFRTVARHLATKYQLEQESVFREMVEILERRGRGKVFDALLHTHRLYSEENVKALLYLYRSHRPKLRLYEDVFQTLRALRRLHFRLGIVTDGLACVQRNKVAALHLEGLFDAVICSDQLGRDCWKPSEVPYQVALYLLDIPPGQAVYVGNDPAKDFLAPNALGMLTIQVRRCLQEDGTLRGLPQAGLAKVAVNSLVEMLPILGGRANGGG